MLIIYYSNFRCLTISSHRHKSKIQDSTTEPNVLPHFLSNSRKLLPSRTWCTRKVHLARWGFLPESLEKLSACLMQCTMKGVRRLRRRESMQSWQEISHAVMSIISSGFAESSSKYRGTKVPPPLLVKKADFVAIDTFFGEQFTQMSKLYGLGLTDLTQMS